MQKERASWLFIPSELPRYTVASFHAKLSTTGSMRSCELRIHAYVGVASANVEHILNKNAIYLSKLGCCSFSHLVFSFLGVCLIADTMRNTNLWHYGGLLECWTLKATSSEVPKTVTFPKEQTERAHCLEIGFANSTCYTRRKHHAENRHWKTPSSIWMDLKVGVQSWNL